MVVSLGSYGKGWNDNKKGGLVETWKNRLQRISLLTNPDLPTLVTTYSSRTSVMYRTD